MSQKLKRGSKNTLCDNRHIYWMSCYYADGMPIEKALKTRGIFMKIAIINLTGGGMSGGYRKYLKDILPRMAASNIVEEILCATPSTIDT